jgi:hypothetical protein
VALHVVPGGWFGHGPTFPERTKAPAGAGAFAVVR